MTAAIGDNRIVQGLWVGGRLSELERLCIRSFCANGHAFHLYHYDELQNVPQADGLHLLNAEEILPRSAIFTYRKQKSLAGFADRFRWELMRQNGGWYTDMDMVCLRPLDFADTVVLGYEDRGGGSINSALMKFPRGHFMAAAMANACADINKFAPWDTLGRKIKKIKRIVLFRRGHKYLGWGEAGGPRATTLAARHFGMLEYAKPAQYFYPVDLHDLDLLFGNSRDEKTAQAAIADSYAVHFWNEFTRKRGINRDNIFPTNSLYEILKRRYSQQEKQQ